MTEVLLYAKMLADLYKTLREAYKLVADSGVIDSIKEAIEAIRGSIEEKGGPTGADLDAIVARFDASRYADPLPPAEPTPEEPEPEPETPEEPEPEPETPVPTPETPPEAPNYYEVDLSIMPPDSELQSGDVVYELLYQGNVVGYWVDNAGNGPDYPSWQHRVHHTVP